MPQPVFKVMIVEDDYYQAQFLSLVLQGMGNYESDIHTSSYGAVEKIINYNPDLVILDLQLPNKEGKIDHKAGYKILKDLRKNQGKRGKNVAVIIYSAVNTLEDKLRSILAGECDDFLVKSCDRKLLEKRIREYSRIGYLNKEYTKLEEEYQGLFPKLGSILKKGDYNG